ncbi:c-type cytochrome [Aestuariicella sp. G3-2]|uniref:c-type cytochrome n=1 Tax=Pseudomaricurvus albidus TaxID=2842452 RepID=UPI001C0D4A3B|nr:c-type cytochrome [Aestuariicella albida]MBU3071704.1 c-type cytochrome [Aestuariicella albida]
MKKMKFNILIFTLLNIGVISQSYAQECDLKKGEKIYTKCAACHSLEPKTNLMGPSLHGVINRESGSLEDFIYSEAMSSSKLIWSKQQLNEFLLNPMQKIPGTTMPFAGLRNEKSRAAVVCYIEHKSK